MVRFVGDEVVEFPVVGDGVGRVGIKIIDGSGVVVALPNPTRISTRLLTPPKASAVT